MLLTVPRNGPAVSVVFAVLLNLLGIRDVPGVDVAIAAAFRPASSLACSALPTVATPALHPWRAAISHRLLIHSKKFEDDDNHDDDPDNIEDIPVHLERHPTIEQDVRPQA